jgi:hypothetical protein
LQLTIVCVDSEELVDEAGDATNAIDGQSETFWHTTWSDQEPPHPHTIVIQ